MRWKFPFVLFAVLLFAGASYGSDDIGAWRRHERQAPSKPIGDIRMLPGGRLFAATAGSFHILDGGRWKKYSSETLSSHIPFFSDARGRLFFNDDGLRVWDNGTFTRVDSPNLIDPVCAAQSGSGTVYIGSYNQGTPGLYTIDGSSAVRVHEGRVRSLSTESDGTLWMTAIPPEESSMRLLEYTNGAWTDRTPEIETHLGIGSNLTVQVAPDDAVWVCSEGPYAVYRNGEWAFYGKAGSGNPIFLKFDRQGGVWGYSYGNLYHLDATGKWAVNRNFQDVLPNDTSFIAASDSAVYTFNSPDSVLISVTSGKTWEPVPDPYDLASNTVTCLDYLEDGTLLCGHGVRGVTWVQSEKRGLSIFNGNTWSNFDRYGIYNFPNVFLIKRSPGGLVYFYSDGGYFTFDGKVVESLDSLSATDYDATDMAWDNLGEMWIATGWGLVKYRYPGWTNSPFPFVMDPYPFVYNLCIDDADNLYMQTWSTQVLMTDQSNWYQYIPGSGRAVNDIAVEGNGTLWGARVGDLSWWDQVFQEWRTVTDFPDSNRLVRIDPQGRIWASGYGKTGYYADGTFRAFPEFAQTASNKMAFSDDGRIALNLFNRVRSDHYGIEEFIPSTVGVKESAAPAPFLTASSYPNPFNPTVTIRFELPSAGPVKITIYNIAGQRVKQLADRRFAAGENRVEWDSRTDTGEMAASGVYLYRIEGGRQVKAGKMLLMR